MKKFVSIKFLVWQCLVACLAGEQMSDERYTIKFDDVGKITRCFDIELMTIALLEPNKNNTLKMMCSEEAPFYHNGVEISNGSSQLEVAYSTEADIMEKQGQYTCGDTFNASNSVYLIGVPFELSDSKVMHYAVPNRPIELKCPLNFVRLPSINYTVTWRHKKDSISHCRGTSCNIARVPDAPTRYSCRTELLHADSRQCRFLPEWSSFIVHPLYNEVVEVTTNARVIRVNSSVNVTCHICPSILKRGNLVRVLFLLNGRPADYTVSVNTSNSITNTLRVSKAGQSTVGCNVIQLGDNGNVTNEAMLNITVLGIPEVNLIGEGCTTMVSIEPQSYKVYVNIFDQANLKEMSMTEGNCYQCTHRVGNCREAILPVNYHLARMDWNKIKQLIALRQVMVQFYYKYDNISGDCSSPELLNVPDTCGGVVVGVSTALLVTLLLSYLTVFCSSIL